MPRQPLYHPRPERWPQFTLKGLLIAFALAALLMPWTCTQYRYWRIKCYVDESNRIIDEHRNRMRGVSGDGP